MATNSQEGESSRPIDQSPIRREFTQNELIIIENDVKIHSADAKKLQEEADRKKKSCIFPALQRLKENNGSSWYEPNMVSIGPNHYNRRKEDLKIGEDFKMKCFGYMLLKVEGDQEMRSQIYKSCLQRISKLEANIQNCYSEVVEVTGLEFLRMMVFDACFIIEMIDMFGHRNEEEKENDGDQSLAAFEWMLPYFHRDFLLLENQIPFFVLEEIYTITRKVIHGRESKFHLIYAALEFFKNGIKFDFISCATERNDHYSPLHLLDLVRWSLIPEFLKQLGPELPTKTTFIHCVSKLLLAGIKVNPVKAQSFLDVKFKKGVIEMPNIAINDLMICLLLNCVAFEQRYKSSRKYFSVYITFLDCLVNTPEDIEYLCERNVIDNYLADDSKAADFINNAGKDLVFSTDDFYLEKLFEYADEHYRTKWKWKLARFTGEYVEKPWLLLSAAGGILLVVGTLVQAIVAFLTYKDEK